MPVRFLAATVAVLLLTSVTAFASNATTAIDAHTAGLASTATSPRIQLNDSVAAMQLAERLPRSLLFSDRMGTAQVAYLTEPPAPSVVDPVSDYRAGDVGYWAAEHSIVIFVTDGAGIPDDSVVLVGHVSDGLGELAGCNRNCLVLVDHSPDGRAGVEETDG